MNLKISWEFRDESKGVINKKNQIIKFEFKNSSENRVFEINISTEESVKELNDLFGYLLNNIDKSLKIEKSENPEGKTLGHIAESYGLLIEKEFSEIKSAIENIKIKEASKN